MREREFPKLRDGSAIYGEGIYGPSDADVEWANQVHQELVRERRRARYRRIESLSNPPEVAPWPLVGRLPRPWRDLVIGGTAAVAGVAAAACFGGGGPKPKPEQPPDTGDNVPKVEAPKDKPKTEQLIIPVINTKNPAEPIFLNSGPHFDGLTGGVRAAVDLAGENVVPCPGGETSKEMAAVAAASGKVTVVGNEKNRADENHSIVEITLENGLTLGYMHLANIKVEVGQEAKQGDILGFLSCEISPGGKTDGQHLHFYIKLGGKYIPIKGFIFSGWWIDESPANYQGTAKKGDSLRVANSTRCPPDRYQKEPKCNGERNDLVEGEVLGVRTTAPTPTAIARPTPTPKPAPTPSPRQEQLPSPETRQRVSLESKAFLGCASKYTGDYEAYGAYFKALPEGSFVTGANVKVNFLTASGIVLRSFQLTQRNPGQGMAIFQTMSRSDFQGDVSRVSTEITNPGVVAKIPEPLASYPINISTPRFSPSTLTQHTFVTIDNQGELDAKVEIRGFVLEGAGDSAKVIAGFIQSGTVPAHKSGNSLEFTHTRESCFENMSGGPIKVILQATTTIMGQSKTELIEHVVKQ